MKRRESHLDFRAQEFGSLVFRTFLAVRDGEATTKQRGPNAVVA